MPRTCAFLCLAVVLALVACGSDTKTNAEPEKFPSDEPLEGFVTVDRLPMPEDPHLIEGRTVWAGTCQACHGLGEAGSPKITDRKAWAPRLAQGLDTLRQHALKGFIGPSGTMMPERGGNPDLTDQQVLAAVDYMVANSR